MYVTRRLSEYQKNPSELTQAPPEGPNSGVLVIQDEESKPRNCFGLCYDSWLKGLPFPQNVKLTIEKRERNSGPVVFIPVLDQPLSSSRYYVINRRGKHSGKAIANATEEDRVRSCFCCSYMPDAKPRPPDCYDIYQQFEIHQEKSSRRRYYATSVAPDGVPPEFLKRKGWMVRYSNSDNFGLYDDAKGLYIELRSELPEPSTRIVIGKWYVPFIFVKEGKLKDQMKRSTYYNMTLEKRWEEIFSFENANIEDHEVFVDVVVEAQVAKIEGKEISQETRSADADGFVWFKATSNAGKEKKIGLASVVVDKMRWEEDRFGWTSQDYNQVRVKRVEKFEGAGNWKSYQCYVLVESFVLRRRDGSFVLTYEFRHADKLRSKWD